MAIKFIHDQAEKDEWLEENFPKQMQVLHQALEQGLVLQQAGGLGILHEFVQIGLGICHTISSISIIYKTDHSIL